MISTPVAIVNAIGAAARAGILVKSGAALEAAAGVRAIAFDKTGTLTRGEPRVVDVISLGDHRADAALTLAVSVEALSEHPLGRAVVANARDRGIAPSAATAVSALPGKGVTGTTGGWQITVGSGRPAREMTDDGDGELAATLDRLAARGETPLVVIRSPVRGSGGPDPDGDGPVEIVGGSPWPTVPGRKRARPSPPCGAPGDRAPILTR